MFKQILIMLLILLMIIFIIKKLRPYFYKLLLSKNIVKNVLTDTIKDFLDLHSEYFKHSELLNNNLLFYTNKKWSTKNNNYIYDKKNMKYYIIDKGYYYYLDSMDNFEIVICNGGDNKIKLYNYDKYNSKIIFV